MVKRVDPNTLNNLHLVLSENCARYQHSLLACLGHGGGIDGLVKRVPLDCLFRLSFRF